MFIENLDAYLRDFGSPVLFGYKPAWAIFDRPEGPVLGGRAQSIGYSIRFLTTALPGLQHHSLVLIGIGPGWTFDATGQRLLYCGDNPGNSESSQFRVLGTPSLVDDGVFLEAQLESLGI